MKKFILLLVVVAFSATTKIANSSNLTKSSVVFGKVPEAVMDTFNGHISNIVEVYFPGSTGWDDSEMVWDHQKSDWACNGSIAVNGGGSITISSGLYSNNGQVFYLYYQVNQ